MLDQVGAVLVVVVVGDIQTHLVHPGCPGEQFAVPVLVEVPGFGHLVESLQRLGLDPRGLLHVDVITLHQEAQRAITNVLVMVAAQQVIEHPFAQGTLGMGHAADLQGIEDRLENRQASGKHAAAIGLDAVDIDLVHLAELEQLALEPADTFDVGLTVAHAAALDSQPDGADGAGCADGLLPAEPAQAMLDAHQLDPRRGVGLSVACRGDLAVTEETLGVAYAAHLQAFAQLRFEAFADDELGAATADIGYQPPARTARDGVRHAQIDQARLFAAGDDFHLMVDDLFGAADEGGAIARLTQRVGADDAYGALRQMIDQLGKAPQAVESALHGGFVEQAVFVDPGGQLDLFSETFKDAHFAIAGAREHHVKTVRAQIQGSDHGKGLGGVLAHWAVSMQNPDILT